MGKNYKEELKIMTDDSYFFFTFSKNKTTLDTSRPCFKGAYYRKIVSDEGNWLGINGKVVLPRIAFDPERKNPGKPGQYLDNPSVYLGGNMNGQETDIGLTWEVVKDENGNVSDERKAFRPFFRRSAYSKQVATWITAPAKSEYYWYPGEEVMLSIQIVSVGKIKFIVKGAGKTYQAVFDCAGYIPGATGEFKRVNAIDLVGNEGKVVQPTKTRVLSAIWKETNLYRKHRDKIVSVPLSSNLYEDMRCPDPGYFHIVSSVKDENAGAEIIDISGVNSNY